MITTRKNIKKGLKNESPDFSFENKAHKKGYGVVAGVDEVGRGSFAGPVVAAAVAFAQINNYQSIFSKSKIERVTRVGEPQVRDPKLVRRRKGLGVDERQDPPQIIINDSKKMNPAQREISSFWIKRNALCYGIGKASVGEINKFGIKKATETAFRRAIKNCNRRIDYLLIDAFYVPYVRGLRRKNQTPIIKGDTKSLSIAAASIIAKVYRDKLMTNLSKKLKYGKYHWDINKGYGTKIHREAIKKYGSTRLHRKKFVGTWLSSFSSSQAR